MSDFKINRYPTKFREINLLLQGLKRYKGRFLYIWISWPTFVQETWMPLLGCTHLELCTILEDDPPGTFVYDESHELHRNHFNFTGNNVYSGC